jgi:hypothetical protein
MSDKHEQQSWISLTRDIAAMITLGAAGVTLALTGHENTASTVFGGLLMYLVPTSSRLPRAAVGLAGAVVGSLLIS